MIKPFAAPLSVLLAVFCWFTTNAAETISVSGKWRFNLDRADAGIGEKWFSRELPDFIQLPGALQSQGFGDEISIHTPWVLSLYDRFWYLRDDYKAYTNAGHVKVPFVCQPPRHYLGAAWYQREIEIPKDWDGRRVVLFLERPHWESRVWLDDQLIGTNNSLCAPHEFELGLVNAETNASAVRIAPGKHTLTVRVDNRLILPYRPDAHSISDSLASTWNGIVGKMELRSTPPVWIEDVQVFPDAASTTITVKGKIGNVTGRAGQAQLVIKTGDISSRVAGMVDTTTNVSWNEAGGAFDISFRPAYPKFQERWDEFNPAVHQLTVGLISENNVSVERAVTVGFRDFTRSGNKLFINGREAHLRGTHNGGDFPLTGYPPMDIEYWRKLIRTCKEWGLNHMRFHSFCPPDAAFQAADELGFYIQVEPGMWNTFNPGSPMEQMLYLETERIIKAYGNHPSFVMFSPSNEPKGRWRDVLPQWAEHFRSVDPRRLYSSGTGFTDSDAPGPLDKVDYTSTGRFGQKRIRGESGWFGRGYSDSLQGVNVPALGHELGQWCAYPDFDVIRKFTDSSYMRPGNFEIFRDSAEGHGLFGDGAHGVTHPTNKDFAWASGRFQLACYKEEIEANLLTPGLAGFQLLDLHDYVGQGTALVGLLDPFWESKGYVTPEEFRMFCNTIVPIARLRNRVFTTADKIEVPIEIANFSATELKDERVSWEIHDRAGKAVASGELDRKTIPIGRSSFGKLAIDFSKLSAPAVYKLVLIIGQPGVRAHSGPITKNEWNLWVYSTQDTMVPPHDVLVTTSWDEAESKLATGGKVLFVPRNADLDWSSPPLDNVPVFWNRLMNPGWGRMLGLWCDTNHPALAEFPTEANCDWQWTQIIRGVRPVNLDRLPRGLQPIIQAIDDWNRNWKLGAIFECRVGKGRLMVSSFDLTNTDRSSVAKALRRSLLDYMASEKFQPKTEVSVAEFKTVLFDTRIMRKLGATVTGPGNVASAVDGDPNTAWIAGGGRNASGAKHPYALTIAFTNAVAMNGLVIMPRQNDRDHAGDVRDYRLESSDDGQQWNEIAKGELPSSWNPQRIEFGTTVTTKQLRFTAVSGFGADNTAALAELAVIYAGPKLAENSSGNMEYQRSQSTSTDVDESAPAAAPKPRNR